MDRLLNPDSGLMFWTVVTFLALVFILKKLAWGPLLSAIEEREARIKADMEAARAARTEAEKIKNDFEAEMAGIQARGRELLTQAGREGEALRAQLKAAAEFEAQRMKEKTMAELSEEKGRLVRELRREVASLSVLAAEKLIRRSVDDSVQKTVLESFFRDLDARGKVH